MRSTSSCQPWSYTRMTGSFHSTNLRTWKIYFRPLLMEDGHHLEGNVYAGRLLVGAYARMEARVNALLSDQSSLNFVFDESPDINSWRMITLSVVIHSSGSIYPGNFYVKDASPNAVYFVTWFLERVARYGGTERVASLTTDTCAVMRGTWAALEKHSKLAHAIIIPCDSHGL